MIKKEKKTRKEVLTIRQECYFRHKGFGVWSIHHHYQPIGLQ